MTIGLSNVHTLFRPRSRPDNIALGTHRRPSIPILATRRSMSPVQVRMQRLITEFLNNVLVSGLTVICIVASLLIHPLASFTHPTAVAAVGIVGTVLFGILVIEIVLLSISQGVRYFTRPFFWMDVAGTLAILTELDWAFGRAGEETSQSDLVFQLSRLTILRAGRLSLIGARLVQPRHLSQPGCVVLFQRLSTGVCMRVSVLVLTLAIGGPLLTQPWNGRSDQRATLTSWGELLLTDNSTNAELDYYNCFRDTSIHPIGFEVSNATSGLVVKSSTNPAKIPIPDNAFNIFRSEVIEDGLRFVSDVSFEEYNLQSSMLSLGLVLLTIVTLVGGGAIVTRSVAATLLVPFDRLIARLVILSGGDNGGEDDVESLFVRLHGQMVANAKSIADESNTAVDLAVTGMASIPEGDEDALSSHTLPSVGSLHRASAIAPTLDEQTLSLSQETIHSWDFNPLTLSEKDTHLFVQFVLYYSPQGAFRNRVSVSSFSNFVTIVSGKYRPNPYHRWAHAVDVCHTVYRYLELTDAATFLSPVERLGLLVSALIHDMGHMGVNNQFLVDTGHELAIRFNDKSPLENFHCSLFFQLLQTDNCNVLAWLPSEQLREIRKVIIDAVLHTDNFYHFGMVKEIGVFVASGDALRSAQGKSLMIRLMLHSADISNPTKPFAVCREWALLVMTEFFAQGDREKELGIPVQPLNDRTVVNVAQSQMGFIEFVVAPLEILKLKLFPAFAPNCRYLVGNMVQWATEYAAQTTPEEEASLLDRCRKVAAIFQPYMGDIFVPASLGSSSRRPSLPNRVDDL